MKRIVHQKTFLLILISIFPCLLFSQLRVETIPDPTIQHEWDSYDYHSSSSDSSIVFIPDTAFLNALIDLGVDTDGDSLISSAEAEAENSLHLRDRGIIDMQGIEAFINLDTLHCGGNEITSLDVSSNTKLKELCIIDLDTIDFWGNLVIEMSGNLTNLNVSNNTELTKLICIGHPITSLIISNSPALAYLDCSWNTLNFLDVSGCSALTHLGCSYDQLTSLDISNCTALTTLDCTGNQLTSLDVSGCTALTNLICSYNQLTSLDVSGLTALTYFDCSENPLTYLDISNNVNVSYLGIRSISDLLVCVWTLPFPPDGVLVDYGPIYDYGFWYETVRFTTDCSPYLSIADTAFLYALIESGVDMDGDSLISYEEASLADTLNVSGAGISGMTEIKFFRNLEYLDCSYNHFPDLDISKNYKLSYMDCSDNPALDSLICHNIPLISLDVSGCTALIRLECSGIQLTNLNASNNPALKYLDCSDNLLTSLDVSDNTALTYLYCGWNQLTSLDVSGCTALAILDCAGNQLTGLDVSDNTALGYLDCSDNSLIRLNISNNSNLKYLNIRWIPDLLEVCVWTEPFPPVGVEVEREFSPYVYFTVDCQPEFVSIPDTAFLYALIENGVDINGDSLISYVEAWPIEYLNVTGAGISDMTGIEAFIRLNYLDCSVNHITSLDVSENYALTYLDCSVNHISSLNVSGNAFLRILDCGMNPLFNLNISNNLNLERLLIWDIQTRLSICVWNFPFPDTGVTVDKHGSPYVNFTIICELNPFMNTDLRICSPGTCKEVKLNYANIDTTYVTDTTVINLYAGDAISETISIRNKGPQPCEFYNVLNASGSPGNQNYAVNFDGVDDYIQVQEYSASDIHHITLEAWVRFESGTAGIYPIISKGEGGKGYELLLTGSGPGKHLAFKIDPGEVLSNETLYENQWYHVAATYDGMQIRLFINGILDSSTPASGSITVVNRTLHIATNFCTIDERTHFKGTMDEVRIWKVARSAAEIHSSMHRPLSGREKGIYCYWPLDDDNDKLIIDHVSSVLGVLDGGALKIPSDAPLVRILDIPQSSGVLPVDSIINLKIDLYTGGFRSGDYRVDIEFYLRDQIVPDIILPVRLHVRDAPSISVQSDTVLFGKVNIHTLNSTELKVKNTGTETLRIDRVCTNLDESRIIPPSASIEPGETRVFQVQLYTRKQQEFESSLCFHTNDPTNPEVNIPVTGLAIRPPNLVLYDLFRDNVRADGDKITISKSLSTGDLYEWYLTCSAISYKHPIECSDRMLQADSSGWMSTSFPDSCSLPPGGSIVFDVTLDPAGLSSGDHYAEMTIHAINPFYIYSKHVFMIHLLVTGQQEWEIQADNHIRIFPNPTQGILTIQTENPGNKTVVITSLNGQVLLETEIDGSSAEIDLSSFDPGIYFITIQSDKTVTTRRIIKQ